MRNHRTYSRAFSTIELLIAMAIMLTTLSAATLFSFSSQNISADRAAESSALSLAQTLIATERALAQKDFALVVPTTTVQTVGGIPYTLQLTSVLQNDYLTKKITATIIWTGNHNRTQSVSLGSYVTNFEHAAAADTCDAAPNGDWARPLVQNTQTSFAQMIGETSAVYTLTSIDAFHNKLYVGATTNVTGAKSFFIFDTSVPASPKLLGSLDTTGTTVSSGPAAVAVATSAGSNYAYVANAYGANFLTCKSRPTDINGGNCAQLQIVNITNPASPVLVENYELPTTTAQAHVTGTGGAAGNAIFYDNGYVYIGLTKTATGPEFNIIDVHDPRNPLWVAGYSIGYVVNGIYVKNNIAYIAHPTDSAAAMQEQVTVLDVTDKTHPVYLSGYKAPDKQGNGKSLYAVGDTLYVGRTVNTTKSNKDFYILNDAIPANLATLNPNTPEPPGQKINSSVNALLARNTLAFLLSGTSGTAGSLQIFDISHSANSAALGTVALPAASSGAALDCEGNTLYAASNDATGHGYVSVIYP